MVDDHQPVIAISPFAGIPFRCLARTRGSGPAAEVDASRHTQTKARQQEDHLSTPRPRETMSRMRTGSLWGCDRRSALLLRSVTSTRYRWELLR